MKKYYYTDLTKVIFMARHYGVKFVDPEDDTRQIRGEEMLNILGEVNGGQREEPKIYVCEESWGIFEPRHDDTGATEKDELPCLFSSKDGWRSLSLVGEDIRFYEEEKCFIITRCNPIKIEHFFAPFVEGE